MPVSEEEGLKKVTKRLKKAGAMTKFIRYDKIYMKSLPELIYVRTNGKYPNEERLRQ